MSSEDECEPDLAKYYPVSEELGVGEFPDITLKNASIALMLLGLIAIMVNLLMLYLFIRQEWVIAWPETSAAQAGVILMCFGVALYLVDRYLERKSR